MSRLTDHLLARDEYRAAGALRDPFATYRATCDLVSIGAYVSGSDPRIERAASLDSVSLFLRQGPHEGSSSETPSQLQDLVMAVTATKG